MWWGETIESLKLGCNEGVGGMLRVGMRLHLGDNFFDSRTKCHVVALCICDCYF